MTEQEHEQEQEGEALTAGVANPAVIDVFGLDGKSGEVVLAMNEPRPWDGSDERLHELQEKFNAYVSFLLDGEMIGIPSRPFTLSPAEDVSLTERFGLLAPVPAEPRSSRASGDSALPQPLRRGIRALLTLPWVGC